MSSKNFTGNKPRMQGTESEIILNNNSNTMQMFSLLKPIFQEGMATRVEVENKINSLEGKIENKINSLEGKIDKLENKLDSKIDSLRKDIENNSAKTRSWIMIVSSITSVILSIAIPIIISIVKK